MKKLFIILPLLLLVSCGKKQYEEQEPPVIRDFNSFIFVGSVKKQPGLYKYVVSSNSFSEFWNSRKEKVIELSYNENHSSAFFLTAVKEGKQGIFPYIKDARLYVIPDSSSTPLFVKDIGSGIQVFSRWESETVFRIVFNSWDKKVSTYINQKTIIFNTFGRILREETKTFDITGDGYPRLPKIKPDSLSPTGKYRIDYTNGKADSVFLTERQNGRKFLIADLSKPVDDIAWSDSRQLLVISTLDVTSENKSIFTKSPNTSALYLYSIPGKKLIREWKGGGYKHFFTAGDFLIFDDGFGRNSSIYVYKFSEDKVIKKIQFRGGCGLTGIPKIPRF
jgi:hypothetical protein